MRGRAAREIGQTRTLWKVFADIQRGEIICCGELFLVLRRSGLVTSSEGR